MYKQIISPSSQNLNTSLGDCTVVSIWYASFNNFSRTVVWHISKQCSLCTELCYLRFSVLYVYVLYYIHSYVFEVLGFLNCTVLCCFRVLLLRQQLQHMMVLVLILNLPHWYGNHLLLPSLSVICFCTQGRFAGWRLCHQPCFFVSVVGLL